MKRSILATGAAIAACVLSADARADWMDWCPVEGNECTPIWVDPTFGGPLDQALAHQNQFFGDPARNQADGASDPAYAAVFRELTNGIPQLRLDPLFAGGLNLASAGGDPVNGNGELVWKETDLELPGFGVPFELVRTYRSRVNYIGPLGFGWDHSYNQRLVQTADCSNKVILSDGAAGAISFSAGATDSNANVVHYVAPEGIPLRLDQLLSGADRWALSDGTGLTRIFDVNGNLHFIKDGAGHQLTFTWTHTTHPPDPYHRYPTSSTVDRLDQVVDTAGRTLYFVYKGAYSTTLSCVSSAPDCLSGHALVTYNVTATLQWVHDANGNGNSYTYLPAQSGTVHYVPDSSIDSTCDFWCSTSAPDATCTMSPCQTDTASVHAACAPILTDYAVCQSYCEKVPSFPPGLAADQCSSTLTTCLNAAGTNAAQQNACRVGWRQCNCAEPNCNGLNRICTAPLADNVPFCAQFAPSSSGRAACDSACHDYYSAQEGGSTKYGKPGDLSYNLLTVVNAENVLVLSNTYGTDPSRPDFDAVIDQQVGPVDSSDTHVRFDYHDLEAETSLFYGGTPDPAHVESLHSFASEDICPASCTGGYDLNGNCLHMTYGSPTRKSVCPTPYGRLPGACSFDPSFKQYPVRAVVIHDLRGAIRTQYYGKRWELLREVNLHATDGQAREITNYNYQRGLPTGVESPAGVRLCRMPDGFNHDLQSTLLPAQGAGALFETTSGYDLDGRITRRTVNPYSTSPALTDWVRDSHGRVTRKDEIVSLQPLAGFSTYYYYQDVNGALAAYPHQVVRPDGSMQYDSYDPYGAAPSQTTLNPEGITTVSYATYDWLGRQTESGQSGRAYLHRDYDAGGRVTTVTRALGPSSPPEVTHQLYGGIDQPYLVYNDKQERFQIFDTHGSLAESWEWDLIGGAFRVRCASHDLVDGRLLAEVLPEGNMVIYTYDDAGRLTAVDQGYPTSFPQWAYDCSGNLSGNSDPNLQPGAFERIRSMQYAPGGALVSRTEGGITTTFTNDGFGRPIEDKDGAGNLTRRGYDDRGRVAWEAVLGSNAGPYAKPQLGDSGLVSMVEHSYDFLGREVRTDRWHFANGQQVETTLAATTTTAYGDDTGHIDTSRAPVTTVTRTEAGFSTVNTLDGAGRTTLQQLPDGSTIHTLWWGDHWSQETRTTPAGNAIVWRGFDNLGQLQFEYDGNWNLLAHKERDIDGHVTSEQSASGGNRWLTYDGWGRLTQDKRQIDGQNNVAIAYSWDRNDRQLSVTDGNLHTTAQRWDALGRRSRLIDAEQRTTLFEYVPGSSRISHSKDPAGTERWPQYDPSGRLGLETIIDGGGLATAGQVTYRSFLYTPAGLLQLASQSSSNGLASTVQMAFDSLGNRISETNSLLGGNFTVTHQYDGRGHPLSTGLGADSISRSYDPLGRLASAALDGRPVAQLAYQGLGGPATISYGQGSFLSAAPVESLTYDLLGRLTGIDVSSVRVILFPRTVVRTPIASFRFALGLDGAARQRWSSFAGHAGTSDLFQVDLSGRLTGESLRVPGLSPLPQSIGNADVQTWFQSPWVPRSYKLDGADNQAERDDASGALVYQLTPVNRISSVQLNGAAVSTPQYDGAGNLSLVTWSESYQTNGLGQLVAASSGGINLTYTYDALGRRIVEKDSSGNASWLVWDGAELLAIGSTSGNQPPAPSAFTLRVGGDGIDRHLALYDRSSGSTRYLYQGPDNSVLAASGLASLIEGYLYSAYGELTVLGSDGQTRSPASSFGNRLLYQGQLQDPALQSYWMRNREYRPAWGRFLSPDPTGLQGGLNFYSFVGAKPLTNTDPYGHDQKALMRAWWAAADEAESFNGVAIPNWDGGKNLVYLSSSEAAAEYLRRINDDPAYAAKIADAFASGANWLVREDGTLLKLADDTSDKLDVEGAHTVASRTAWAIDELSALNQWAAQLLFKALISPPEGKTPNIGWNPENTNDPTMPRPPQDFAVGGVRPTGTANFPPIFKF